MQRSQVTEPQPRRRVNPPPGRPEKGATQTSLNIQGEKGARGGRRGLVDRVAMHSSEEGRQIQSLRFEALGERERERVMAIG